MALVIVHTPGMAPRLGHTPDDDLATLRQWRDANPGAAIYVVDAQVLPSPGTAWVSTIEEAIFHRGGDEA